MSQTVAMAQWIRRLPTEQEIAGSSPVVPNTFLHSAGLLQLVSFWIIRIKLLKNTGMKQSAKYVN